MGCRNGSLSQVPCPLVQEIDCRQSIVPSQAFVQYSDWPTTHQYSYGPIPLIQGDFIPLRWYGHLEMDIRCVLDMTFVAGRPPNIVELMTR